MKKLSYLACLILTIACHDVEKKKKASNTLEHSKFNSLLIKYPDISFDTLKIFSSGEFENNTNRFKGILLDSTNVSLFPKILSEQYAYDHGFFACYKFEIDSTRIGLITRTPSTYEPSSIKLLIFDRKEDAISGFIELAETFGDAGDYADKTSWLFKDEHRHNKCLMWYSESHDNSVDDETDTTIQEWNNYYLFDIEKPQPDTISKDEQELKKRFWNLLK